MPNFNKAQKRTSIVAIAITVLAAAMMLQTTNAQSEKSDSKSMAWYTANIKVAEAKNKECRANPENTELQATPDCVNALKALELSFGLKR